MRHVELHAFVLAVVEAAAEGLTEAEVEAETGAGARDKGGDADERGLDDVSTFGPVMRGF